MCDIVDERLQRALATALKKALTLEADEEDIEEENQQEQQPESPINQPFEQLQVSLHPYTNSLKKSIVIVLEDYLEEKITHFGNPGVLGDQDRYSLCPSSKKLVLSKKDLMNNKWVEFLIISNDFQKKDINIWLKTQFIYTNNIFPHNIELVDNNYKYILNCEIFFKNDKYYFENIFIRTID